jgi:uncharacterized protein (DUF885 family)
MKYLLRLFAIILMLSSCGQPGEQISTEPADSAFTRFEERFIEALWMQFPGWASSSGRHEFDSILNIPDSISRQSDLHFCHAWLDSLKSMSSEKLSSSLAMDLKMIQSQLESQIWYNSVFKSWEWNPAEYNLGGTFGEILNNKQVKLDQRLRNLLHKTRNGVRYYAAAIKNLKAVTPEHTELAITQNEGAKGVFLVDIPTAADSSGLTPEEKQLLKNRCADIASAIDRYVTWLKRKDLDTSHSCRIGKSLYAQKFIHDIQSGMTAEELYRAALGRKKMLHEKMDSLSRLLYPRYFRGKQMPKDSLQLIGDLIQKLSERHVHRDSFQTAIEKQIPELTAFVGKNNLLYLDPTKPLVVRKEPDWMAGVAGASISAPGPYEKNGETFYNVGSLKAYSAEDAESYLREYNHYILQILNIHEAIPGHYAQLVYSNKSRSLIKSLFGNGSMVEGWAVYTELMMLENGYGENSPEMWLMYYKWNLRTVCNTILDYSVHNLDMFATDGIDFLIKEAFQQRKEAQNKWKRATLTQVQLTSYFNGFSEIMNLRQQIIKKQGKDFSLKSFHEKFLGYGSAPVRLIAQDMTEK